MSVVLDANALVVLALDRRRAPAVEARLREQTHELASALDRFPRLYEIGNQAVREAVVETAARLGPNAPGSVKALVRRGASDKSWRVRQAAQATDDAAT